MIDMHSHILCGVDDGAQTLDESLAMIDLAAETGFDTLVLTPHYMSYKNYTSSPEQNEAILDTIRANARKDVTLVLGNELLYDYKLRQAYENHAFRAIGDTDYYLIETTREGGSAIALQSFMHYLHKHGKKTILAHPERYDFVHDDPNVLLDFMEQGTLIQSNYLSLIDYYDRATTRTLKIMLEHDMVQLMGSDAHQTEGYELYPRAEKVGKALIGDEKWHTLFETNPRKVLANETPDVDATGYKTKATKTMIGNPGDLLPW